MGKKILLDAPTDRPALGYEGIAAAFADIITNSQPNFAIGIFGGWGSGKTTLMGAIKTALPAAGLLTVDFNAWRFEREPHLLVPLLDTIRGALADRAAQEEQSTGDGGEAPDVSPRLRRVAGRVGRVVKALATGLSGSVGIPGAVTIKYDASAAITALDALAPVSAPDSEDTAPKSLYVAAFGELRTAFQDVADAGITRIVVFVDDLDRCLPANALDTLESIKLFFDLPGFVFVVGLDESAIDRALATKLTAAAVSLPIASDAAVTAAGAAPRGQLGREYAKKIFQVPYTLPVMLPAQLDDLLKSMYDEAGIEGDQLADLSTRVRRYLDVIAVQRRVNPREVKRFINSYTLQTLIRPDLVPEAILALQTIDFHPDWHAWYEAVSSRPDEFRKAVEKYRRDIADIYRLQNLTLESEILTDAEKSQKRDKIEDEFVRTSGTHLEFSDEMRTFLRSDLMSPLVEQPDLDPYLSSIQSTRTPDAPFISTGTPFVPMIVRTCGFTEDSVVCDTPFSFPSRPTPMPDCPNVQNLTAHQFVW
jgi:hypothetical protein